MRRLWTVLSTPRVIPQEHLNLEFLLAHAFTTEQTVTDSERFIGTYVVEIVITSIANPRDFPLIRTKDSECKIRYENKCIRLVVDQIMFEYMVEFQEITCDIIQGIYWVGDNAGDELRKHTIRDAIKTLFNQRAYYKKQGSPLQEVFKLIHEFSVWKDEHERHQDY